MKKKIKAMAQQLRTWLRQKFPSHQWQDTGDALSERRTCTVCDCMQEFDQDDWGGYWIPARRGKAWKH